MKRYKIKPTKKQLVVFKEAWKRFKIIESQFYDSVTRLEKQLEKEAGIKDIEFIHDSMCGGWYGIGNADRTMPFLEREELE